MRQGRAPARRRRPGSPGSRPRPAGAARVPARPRQSELDLALTAALSAPAPAATTFRELGLPAPLVAALAGQGIDGPFAIQARALPDALAGRDVLGRAQTGSGKTLAFGLPMLVRLAAAAGPRREGAPRGLVLVPTRELAKQVANVLEPLGRPLGVTVTTVYGGASMGVQIDRLRRGVDIVVATPGRLIDLLDRRACTLSRIEITVLDEADHMADLGFFPAVTRILDETPAGGQRLLFSATLDRDVERLVSAYLADPALHAVAPVDDVATAADHQVFVLPAADKFAVAAELAGRPDRTLFFVRTKHGAARLAKQLTRAGAPSAAIHGNLNQNQRHRALASFAEGHPRVLVATDVAARGLHIDDVGLVVHFDPPHDHKDYLHRSGRTARAGASGTVVALVDPAQVGDVARLHDAAGITPTSHRVAAGHEAVREVATAGTPVPPPPARIPAARTAARSRGPAGAGRPGRPAGSSGRATARSGSQWGGSPGRAGGPGRSYGPARTGESEGARAGGPDRGDSRAQAPARQRADGSEGRAAGGPPRGSGAGRGNAGTRGAAPGRRGAAAGARDSSGGTREAAAGTGWSSGGAQRPARPGRPRRPRPGFRQAS
jgi:superfamily II DNA/RNA helicase